jgi:hypothetical protein
MQVSVQTRDDPFGTQCFTSVQLTAGVVSKFAGLQLVL